MILGFYASKYVYLKQSNCFPRYTYINDAILFRNKDGAELTIDKKHFELRYEEAEDSLTLVLNKATKEDAGSYSCVISNAAGSETTSSKLEVKGNTAVSLDLGGRGVYLKI